MGLPMNEKEKQMFLAGGFLFVIGFLALYQTSFDAALLLMGLGTVLMAVALGRSACKKVFDFFLSIFKDFWRTVSEGRR